MKARQLYRIVDIYELNDEKWVSIQKHDTQFRAKKYQVKVSEIIPLPGQTVVASDSETSVRTRPLRKSAEKARELFSKLCFVKSSDPPTHGWDYDRMLELYEAEDDIYPLIAPIRPPQAVIDHDSETSSDSPTQETSDEFEDANDINSDSSSTLAPSTASNSSDQPPPMPPRLPSDLNNVHNLDGILQIPEVHAAAIQGIIDNARNFLAHHPRPPYTPPRRSARNVSKPSNYAEFSKTGKK